MKEFSVEMPDNSHSDVFYLGLIILVFLVFIRLYLAYQKKQKAKAAELLQIQELEERAYPRLVSSLQMMAQPYEVQKSLLPDFVDAPYEVVNDFDIAYRLLYALIKTGRVTKEQVDALDELDRIIKQIDWKVIYVVDESEITNLPVWAAMRQQAIVVLQKLNEPIEPPQYSFSTYVGGD